MTNTKNKKQTPLFKKFFKLRENIQNRKKILKFKKKKWENFIKFYKKKSKPYKKFKSSDHYKYFLTRYGTKGTGYKKRFRDKLNISKSLRLMYGGLIKSFFKKKLKLATKKKIKFDYKTMFLKMFESQLNTVLYRSKFCTTVKEASQMILHGKVYVNNKQIKNKSYLLNYGDLIHLDRKYLNMSKIIKLVEYQITWPIPPKYLLINYKTMQILFLNNIELTNLSTLYLFNLRLQKIINNYLKQH
jgi:ribosomal protein S4